MGACNSSASDNAKKHQAPSTLEQHESLLELQQGSVLGIASRGNVIACCGDNKTISICERQHLRSDASKNYSPLHLSGHDKSVNRVHFDSCNDLLYSASRDLSVRLWKASGDFSHRYTIANAHTLNVAAVTTHAARPNHLFSASRDYSVKMWDISRVTSESSNSPISDESQHVSAVANYHAPRNIVTSLTTCSYETDLIYQGSEDLCVRVWDLRQSSATVPAIHLTGYVYFPLCLDRQQHDGGYLLASGTKGFNSVGCGVMIWDMRQVSKPLYEFKGHSQDVTSVQFSKHPNRTNVVYSTCKDGSFMVWDVNSLKQVGSFRFEGNKLLSCLTVLQQNDVDMEEVAVGAMDGSVTILSASKDENSKDEDYDVCSVVSTASTVQSD